MIATTTDYKLEHAAKNISIKDKHGKDIFNEKHVNANSYDLTLSDTLVMYNLDNNEYIDLDKVPTTEKIQILDDGFILKPGELYLGSTNERTWASNKWVPFIEGRSTFARAGLTIHVTAGVGDIGFDGHWTLEMHCIKPIKIVPNMRIAQLILIRANNIEMLNYKDFSGNYQHQDHRPKPYKPKNYKPK